MADIDTPTTQKKKKLTKKQRGFVKDYVATGNGTQAALANYDTEDPVTAAAIATENLNKPLISSAIEDALKDEDLAEKHKQLLNAVHLERLVFDSGTTDAEIIEVVSKMPGHELLNIVRRRTMIHENGDIKFTDVFAYVKAPDNVAQDKALDKAYKIKGSYAPEKHAHGHFKIENGDRKKAGSAIKGALD